jgi:hypothetical protein
MIIPFTKIHATVFVGLRHETQHNANLKNNCYNPKFYLGEKEVAPLCITFYKWYYKSDDKIRIGRGIETGFLSMVAEARFLWFLYGCDYKISSTLAKKRLTCFSQVQCSINLAAFKPFCWASRRFT